MKLRIKQVTQLWLDYLFNKKVIFHSSFLIHLVNKAGFRLTDFWFVTHSWFDLTRLSPLVIWSNMNMVKKSTICMTGQHLEINFHPTQLTTTNTSRLRETIWYSPQELHYNILMANWYCNHPKGMESLPLLRDEPFMI